MRIVRIVLFVVIDYYRCAYMIWFILVARWYVRASMCVRDRNIWLCYDLCGVVCVACCDLFVGDVCVFVSINFVDCVVWFIVELYMYVCVI